MKNYVYRKLAAFVALMALATGLLAFDTTKVPVSPDGVRAAIDAPNTIHMQNTGGTDGAGLCVFTSVTVAAKWQNLPTMYGFRKFAEGRPGGSWPEGLERDLKLYEKRQGIKLPPYVQHTGGDEAFLDLCVATRRMPGITYAGLDGWYDSGIAHMVNLSHLDPNRGAIIDNNRAGSWVWGTRKQIVNRWKGKDDNGRPILVPVSPVRWVPVGGGWAFVWLTPPPPPRVPSKTEAVAESENAPVLVWEREILDGRAFWFVYVNGELAWVVDPDKVWHKATGPESWEIDPSDAPEGISAPDDFEPTSNWNNGLAIDRLGTQHRYWINGVECSRAKAFAAVADPIGLVDDSDRYHLTIISNSKLTPEAEAVIAKYARRLHVQVIAPDSWLVKDRVISDVQLQEPAKIGGKVVGAGGDASAESLQRILGEVFDPPAPNDRPADPAPVDPAPVAPAKPNGPVLLAVILGLLLLIFRKGS